MNEHSEYARNRTARAISSAVPRRRNGVAWVPASICSYGMTSIIVVLMNPGARSVRAPIWSQLDRSVFCHAAYRPLGRGIADLIRVAAVTADGGQVDDRARAPLLHLCCHCAHSEEDAELVDAVVALEILYASFADVVTRIEQSSVVDQNRDVAQVIPDTGEECLQDCSELTSWGK